MKHPHASRAFPISTRLTRSALSTAIFSMIAFLFSVSVSAEQSSDPLMDANGSNNANEIALSETDPDTAEASLVEAKRVLEQARELAEQIVAEANAKANGAKQQSEPLSQLEQDAQILTLRNAKVSVELQAGTVEEITRAIMPAHWRIMFDVKDPGLKQRRFQYISTKPREQALNDLLRPLGMQHQYFYELQDENGNSSPLLVVSQR